MVRLSRLIIPVLVLVAAGAPSARGDNQKSEPGGTEPEVFGPGVLSAGEVYRGCFMPNGREFYFFKKVTPGQEDYRIFVSRLTGGTWTEPRKVNLGGDYSDTYPAIAKDGRRLVFASYRPAPGDTSKKPNAHLWYVERKGDGWGEPVFMAAASLLGYYHSWVEFGPDGSLYFRRTTPDWSATETLLTRWDGRAFTAPAPYAQVERWKAWRPQGRADFRIAGGSPGPDGNTIFFDVATRNPRTGRGASDIWVSVKKRGDWTEPRPLDASINREGYDVFPFFSPDGRYLYFVRDFKTYYRLPFADAVRGAR